VGYAAKMTWNFDRFHLIKFAFNIFIDIRQICNYFSCEILFG
jgi:hypothetical protein